MTQKLILVTACAKLGQTVVPCGLGLFRPGTKLWINNYTVSEKNRGKGLSFLKLSGNPEHIYLFHFVHAQQIAYVILNIAGICWKICKKSTKAPCMFGDDPDDDAHKASFKRNVYHFYKCRCKYRLGQLNKFCWELEKLSMTHTHTLHFNGHFPGEPGLAGCPLILLHLLLDCTSFWDKPKLSCHS